jgi:hypothetical protein
MRDLQRHSEVNDATPARLAGAHSRDLALAAAFSGIVQHLSMTLHLSVLLYGNLWVFMVTFNRLLILFIG